MAQNAGNPADKASWLRLAASWLDMIKNEPQRFFAARNEDDLKAKAVGPFWPAPADEDSQASH